MYRNQPVDPGATIRIDDEAALMLTRVFGGRMTVCSRAPARGTPRTAPGDARSRRGESRRRAGPHTCRTGRSALDAVTIKDLRATEIFGDIAIRVSVLL
jgi:hypothetical protein